MILKKNSGSAKIINNDGATLVFWTEKVMMNPITQWLWTSSAHVKLSSSDCTEFLPTKVDMLLRYFKYNLVNSWRRKTIAWVPRISVDRKRRSSSVLQKFSAKVAVMFEVVLGSEAGWWICNYQYRCNITQL